MKEGRVWGCAGSPNQAEDFYALHHRSAERMMRRLPRGQVRLAAVGEAKTRG